MCKTCDCGDGKENPHHPSHKNVWEEDLCMKEQQALLLSSKTLKGILKRRDSPCNGTACYHKFKPATVQIGNVP
jgi:hypothetical protein